MLYNIKNYRTGEWMLGCSCDKATAERYCNDHYISRYGSYFGVEPVKFENADWLPRELRCDDDHLDEPEYKRLPSECW